MLVSNFGTEVESMAMRLDPLSSPLMMGTKRRSGRMMMPQSNPRRIITKTKQRILQKQTVKDVFMNVF